VGIGSYIASTAMNALGIGGSAGQKYEYAVPSTVTICEVTGQKRKIVLSCRCLPFQGVETNSLLRHKITYYPGATEATAQVFGPDHTGLTLHGMWNTRYMDEKAFVFSANNVMERKVTTAEEGRKILTGIWKAGQQVSVAWGSEPYVQYGRGLLVEAKFNENRPQDIGWELIFKWVSDTEINAKISVQKDIPSTKSLLDKLKKLVNDANEFLDSVEGAYKEYVLGTVNQTNTMINDVFALAERVEDIAALPATFAKSIAIVAGNVKQGLVDVQTNAIWVAAQYDTVGTAWQELGGSCAWTPWNANGDSPSDDLDTQVMLCLRAIDQDQYHRQVAAAAQRLLDRAKTMMEPEVLDICLVKHGDTLRRISMTYYGTQDQWQALADYNDLETDVLTAGMVLLIPALQ